MLDLLDQGRFTGSGFASVTCRVWSWDETVPFRDLASMSPHRWFPRLVRIVFY